MGSLTKKPKQGSFYESFTDLIFGTLVIFIVLVMALALRLHDLESKASEAMEELRDQVLAQVSRSRFGGGPDHTIVHVAHLPIDGEVHMTWIPVELADQFRFRREVGRNDPVLDLCRLVLEPEGLSYLSADEVVGMEQGLTDAFVDWDYAILDHGSLGARIYALRRLIETSSERFTPEQLKAELGGLEADEDAEWSRASNRVRQFAIEYYDQLDFDNPWWQLTTGRLEELLTETIGEPAVITVESIREGAARIGRTQLTSAELRAMLRATKPGRGFYVQHVSNDGQPADPPDWLYEDILVPLGFDRRLVREEALRLLEADLP